MIDIRNSELQLENHQMLKMLPWCTGHSDIDTVYTLHCRRTLSVTTVAIKPILQEAREALHFFFQWSLNHFCDLRITQMVFLWSLVNNAWESTLVIICKYWKLECFYLMIWRWFGLRWHHEIIIFWWQKRLL